MSREERTPAGATLALSLAGWLLLQCAAGAQTLREVRVQADAERESATSAVPGYKASNAVTGTKTDTPLAETPQAVTVITRDQMVDQAATGV